MTRTVSGIHLDTLPCKRCLQNERRFKTILILDVNGRLGIEFLYLNFKFLSLSALVDLSYLNYQVDLN